jgi:hypothetical protein
VRRTKFPAPLFLLQRRCSLRRIDIRVHGERGLHRHGGVVAGIDALELARDQAVGDIAEAGAAVLFRNGRPEQVACPSRAAGPDRISRRARP